LLLCLVVAAAGCRHAAEEPVRRGRVRVAAAEDLSGTFGDLIVRFGQSHDVDVAVSFGSPATLYRQLLEEAPFDMFFSDDVAYPNQLASRGLTVPQSEFTYAVGRLVLWTPSSSALDIEPQGLQSLTAATIAQVAIVDPDDGPYGRAAVAALQSAGIYDAVRRKLVMGGTVTEAMHLVESGAADAGFIPLTLALATSSKDKGRRFDIAVGMYPRLEHGGTILRRAADLDAARALRGFVLSADGQAILKQHGFFPPDR
jgi:molybdate transport system substrate-binding protein